MGDGIRDVVHQFVRTMNHQQITPLLDLFSPDAWVDAGPRFTERFEGRVALERLFRTYWKALPDLCLLPREIFVHRGEAVAVVQVLASISEFGSSVQLGESAAPGKRFGWIGAFHFVLGGDHRIESIHIFGDESTARWLPPESGDVGRPPDTERPGPE